MKSKFLLEKIDNSIINKYLFYKNLLINRKFSSNKDKIKKIDHYLWWFGRQKKRTSTIIKKDDKPIFISTCDHYKFSNYQVIYSGLLSCTEETNLFDLLKAIKIQNIYLDSKKKRYCFISIDKKNKVLLHHWKYFGYKELGEKDKKFKNIIKNFNIKSNFNIYYKYIV